jgi:hypothetical protein
VRTGEVHSNGQSQASSLLQHRNEIHKIDLQCGWPNRVRPHLHQCRRAECGQRTKSGLPDKSIPTTPRSLNSLAISTTSLASSLAMERETKTAVSKVTLAGKQFVVASSEPAYSFMALLMLSNNLARIGHVLLH